MFLVLVLSHLAVLGHAWRVQSRFQDNSKTTQEQHNITSLALESLLLASHPRLAHRFGWTRHHNFGFGGKVSRNLLQTIEIAPTAPWNGARPLQSVDTTNVTPVALLPRDEGIASQHVLVQSQKVAESRSERNWSKCCMIATMCFAFLWGSSPLLSRVGGLTARGGRMAVPTMTDSEDAAGTATVPESIITMAKNLIGSCVLTLASGVAAFSASRMALFPAIAILSLLATLSGYTFTLVARVSEETGGQTFVDTWAKVYGKGSAFIPALATAFLTFSCSLSYSIILGDSLASMASLTGLPSFFCKPNTWIAGLTGLVLLPLSLMRDLSSLAVGSLIGTAGAIYTALFMWLRFFDRTYAKAGVFHAIIDESARPLFVAPNATRPLINGSIWVLISILATFFMIHFNAPRFYRELKPTAGEENKWKRFNRVVVGGFGTAAFLGTLMMAAGYLTFGGAAQGLILNSYAASDPLAYLARLGICASIIFSFPLNFVGLRESILDVLNLDGSKAGIHAFSTLGLILATSALSLVIKDLGIVLAIGGAVAGSALVYIFPALMFIQATLRKRRAMKSSGLKMPVGRLTEMYASYGLIGIGIAIAVIGVRTCLKSVA